MIASTITPYIIKVGDVTLCTASDWLIKAKTPTITAKNPNIDRTRVITPVRMRP